MQTGQSKLKPHDQQTLPVQTPEQFPYSRREIVLTMIGVLLITFLAMLDQTIVGTAIPRIVADLQGFDRITWVTTAYLLTSTVTIPIYGKLSDLYGRKPLFLFGIVVFLVGSVLSGTAQSMNQLIVFRAFQGLGAGALIPIAVAVVGDLFSPRERGKWQGLTGGVYGLAAVIGPLAGGWLTDNASWRWVFYVNIPVGIVAFLALLFLMPMLKGETKKVSIDYVGAVLLILGTVPLLLGFTLAGTQFAWLSPQIVGLFCSAVVVLSILVIHGARSERQGKEPVFEPGMFKNSPRIFGISILVTMIISIGLYGCAFAIPLFVQGVIGTSATNSGLILIPFMVTSIGGSIISGQLLSRSGKYKWVAILGLLVSIVGTLLLVRLDAHSGYAEVLVAMVVLGLGVGSGLAVYTVVVQNAMPQKLGQASSALIFFRQLGGTIGLAAMGSVLSSSYIPAYHNALTSTVMQVLPTKALAAFDNPLILLSSDALTRIHAGFAAYGSQGVAVFNVVLEAVKTGLAQSVHNVFVFSLGIFLLGLVSVFFLKEIPLREGRGRRASGLPSESAENEKNVAQIAN